MDLNEFVTESILEIAMGLRAANAKLEQQGFLRRTKGLVRSEDSASPYVMLYGASDAGDRGVEFNVAVTAKGVKDGGGKLAVAGLGDIGGKYERTDERVSRVKFLVHVNYDVS